jgi:hypothetical protein
MTIEHTRNKVINKTVLDFQGPTPVRRVSGLTKSAWFKMLVALAVSSGVVGCQNEQDSETIADPRTSLKIAESWVDYVNAHPESQPEDPQLYPFPPLHLATKHLAKHNEDNNESLTLEDLGLRSID